MNAKNNILITKMHMLIINLLEQRYENNKTLMLCTTLDPRFKVHFLENDEMVHILKSTLNQICEETWLSWFSQLSKEENIPRTFLLAPTIKKTKKLCNFW